MRRWKIGFWLTVAVIGLIYTLSEARTRNTHGLPSSGEEQAAWWGSAGQSHVVSGCIHGLSASTSGNIADCEAFVKDTGPPERLRFVWEDEVCPVTYNAGDGTYWLIVYAGNVTDVVGGWTRVPGTAYLWQLSPTHPATIPNKGLLVMASTVLSGAITAVDTTLHATHPFVFDRTEYASRYGFKCDGLASSAAGNDAALVAAVAALPLSGGRVVLPAERFSCTLSTAFAPTKTVHLQGAGGGRVNAGFFWRTKLEYVGGPGNIIEIINKPTVGAHLEGFEIINTGTATSAINMAFTSNVHVEDVSINFPPVPFTDATIIIGDQTTAHSVTMQRVYLRETGPTGIRIQRTNHTKITDSTFRHHTVCNIDVGGGTLGRAKDTHIITTAVENTKPGATAICLMDAEGVFINRSHFEQSGDSFAAIATFATSSQMEHVVIRDNWFTVIGLAPSTANVISFDRPNTYAVITGNRLAIAEDSALASGAFVSVPNTSGVAYLTIRDNLLVDNNEGFPRIEEINFPENVTGRVQMSGNYGLTAGQIPLTPDNISPWCITATIAGSVTTGESVLYTCTIPGGTFYTINTQGFRFTAAGTTAANGNNKRVRIRLQGLTGAVLWDTGTQIHDTGNWYVTCMLVPAGTSFARGGCHGGVATSGVAGSSFTESGSPPLTGVDPADRWTTNQNIVVTGEAATTDNDVTVVAATLEVIR